jgi:hypothetical protein
MNNMKELLNFIKEIFTEWEGQYGLIAGGIIGAKVVIYYFLLK